MNNTRFATAIHIMILLTYAGENWMSSEFIAGSIQVNPVIVRKELISLRKFGLVESKKGKEGGVRLAKSPDLIFLSDIYLSVNVGDVLGRKNQNPNPECAVGRIINVKLDDLYKDVDQLVVNILHERSLADFSAQFS